MKKIFLISNIFLFFINILWADDTVTTTKTITPTWTETIFITYTRTFTPTFTNSVTLTDTSTESPIQTFTFTYTITFTETITSTPTFTYTNSPTFTFTQTNTITPTISFSPTFSVTSTKTNTPTITITNTPFYTPTISVDVLNIIKEELYPNPAKTGERIFILYEFKKIVDLEIIIYTLDGRIALKRQEKNLLGNGKISIDLKNIAPGVYFYNIIKKTGEKIEKNKIRKLIIIR